MRLILREDVDHLGPAGEVVNVKPGYARNYLIPKGLAYRATDTAVKLIEEERRQRGERTRRDYLEARRRASQLEGKTFTLQARASEEGRLFGSVTQREIAEQATQSGIDFEVERRHVALDEPIKALGEYRVPIRLGSEVEVEVRVVVEAEAV